jgi:ATP:ADP antiporter, AAA family
MRLGLGNIVRAMDIEKHETKVVFLLLSQSFFIGIYSGALDIAANSLFLEKFPSEMLPKAFTISGIAGIVLTALYSFFQNRIGFKTLALLNLVVISAITILLWAGFKLDVGKGVSFAILVMLGPLIILSMLGFWGTAGRIFTLRQGKRLFGLIDTGQIVGIIISSYAIPVILSFGISTYNILLLCSGSVFVALLFQVYIAFGKNIFTSDTKPSKVKEERTSFFTLLKNRFVRLMAIFVGLSMVCAFFVYYSFLAVTKTRYPDATEFGQFFGFFTGTLMIVTLLLKTLVYNKFMKTYGLKIGLAISSVILIILTLLASVVGTFGGYKAEAGGFIFFFLVIVLSRLLSRTLKDSIEAPSFKILYQSVDKKNRYDVQSRIDGTVNEISALFAGVLLAVIGTLSFVSILHYSYVLFVLLSVWIMIAFRLYREYKKNLSSSLASSMINNPVNIMAEETAGTDAKETRLLWQEMDLYKLTKPLLYHQLVKESALPDKTTMQEWLHKLRTADTLDVKKNPKGHTSEEYLTQLMHSRYPEKRQEAAHIMATSIKPEFIPLLKVLLRDNFPDVRKEVIKVAAGYPDKEIMGLLAENLLQPLYSRDSFEALYKMGLESVDSLEQVFYRTGNDNRQLVRIIRLMGSIGGNKALKYLFPKLHHPSREVGIEATKQLKANNFHASEDDYSVPQALKSAIGIAAWNIAILQDLRDEEASDLLVSAIQEELEDSVNHVYNLLSLMYDRQSIEHIRQTLSSEGESAGYALELLDLIVAEDIKPILFPLFDDVSGTEKVKQLQDFFSLEKRDLPTALKDLLNRDRNFISLWTKACVLCELKRFSIPQIDDDIIALLFHPETLIYQLTAQLIAEVDRTKLDKVLDRLPENNKVLITAYFENLHEKQDVPFDYLITAFKTSSIFEKVPGRLLYSLISKLSPVVWPSLHRINQNKDEEICWLWIVYGKIEITTRQGNSTFGPDQFIDVSQYEIVSARTLELSHVYKLNASDYHMLLFDFPEVAQYFVFEMQ